MHRRPGFTLIEVLMVMVILGVLAAIATQFFWDARDRALVATMQSDLRSLSLHQEAFFDTSMRYANDLSELHEFTPSAGLEIDITYAAGDGWAARVEHPAHPEQACWLRVGEAPAPDEAAGTMSGVIACD